MPTEERVGEADALARRPPTAARKRGRPQNYWRIRVVRIDAEKYPAFQRDRDHPFASMSVEARIEEIDSFCARLWVRTLKSKNAAADQSRSAAA